MNDLPQTALAKRFPLGIFRPRVGLFFKSHKSIFLVQEPLIQMIDCSSFVIFEPNKLESHPQD